MQRTLPLCCDQSLPSDANAMSFPDARLSAVVSVQPFGPMYEPT
jgi:hypothetical protein